MDSFKLHRTKLPNEQKPESSEGVLESLSRIMSILLSCLFSWINNPQVIIIMTKVFIQRKILPVNTILNALEIRLEKKNCDPPALNAARERKNDRMSIQISYKHLTVQP